MRTFLLFSILILAPNVCIASNIESLLSCRVLSNEVRIIQQGEIKKFSGVKDRFDVDDVLSMKIALQLSHIDWFTQLTSPPMYDGDKGQRGGGVYFFIEDDKREMPFQTFKVDTINYVDSYDPETVQFNGYTSMTMREKDLRLSDFTGATLTLENYDEEKWNGGISISKIRRTSDGINEGVYNQDVGLDCKIKIGTLTKIFSELKTLRDMKNL